MENNLLIPNGTLVAFNSESQYPQAKYTQHRVNNARVGSKAFAYALILSKSQGEKNDKTKAFR
jgi:hypothetical protein